MADNITGDMIIRDVSTRYPVTETVFARHGLEGCGGPKGPMEPIEFFAKVHRVNVAELLRDLNDAVAGKALTARPEPQFKLAQITDLYKPFLYASLIIVLTSGAALGAVNLLHMASRGAAVTLWPALTQVHAHLQIVGWVGLFIMGVAYTVVPRLKGMTFPAPKLAVASLVVTLAGILLRAASQPWPPNVSTAASMAVSGVLVLAGASMFAGIILHTLRTSKLPAEGFERYIRSGVIWMWVGAASNLALLVVAVRQGTNVVPEALQTAYFTSQLWGFMGLMILAIGQRVHPDFLGLKAPSARALSSLFWPINGSLVLLVVAEALQAFPHGRALDYVYLAGALGLAGSLIAFLLAMNIFHRPAQDLRSMGVDASHVKFMKTAYGWLLVSALMLLGLSTYQAASGQPFPYFWTGALRHALAVGFVSTMIVGQASRIVPVFAGNKLYSVSLLTPIFWLLTIGTAMRVGGQITGGLWGGPGLAIMGISGFLQWVALGLFGYDVWRSVGKREEPVVEVSTPAPSARITGDMIVGDVLEKYPQALSIFLSHGFAHLANPVARQTMAKTVTIAQATRVHGIDTGKLVEELNHVCG